jgi:hypothetical protein
MYRACITHCKKNRRNVQGPTLRTVRKEELTQAVCSLSVRINPDSVFGSLFLIEKTPYMAIHCTVLLTLL